MKNYIIIILLAAGLFIQGCDEACISESGPIVSREINLSSFNSFTLMGSGNVYITQGPEQKVVIEAASNVIDLMNRDVRGGHWDIYNRECIRNIRELNIYITIPDIQFIGLSGSGRITSQNTLITQDLEIVLSGSGDINAAVQADDINNSISGSGNIELFGETDHSSLKISGSGSYRSFGMESRTSNVNITGSGNAQVHAVEALDVRISGSGSVYYEGNPQLTISITGSGKVIPN
ncbi:head GIN domain-containing protein [Fulvivirga sedimenti]|uniref:DUF2807 domain-containing protein n=1 Tax=Fulvivirga sedimenti TaxID=2879465 RepID=A0A9X1HXD6_9BACT|nr:head GIN domain-containing protein [Fulvivirga sedimenti]MCA6078788.1 DUF2807 domain-containing protein [Fulvivirga sedimenti]